jgi:hypothetical protein
MTPKYRLIRDTQRRNVRFTQLPITVLDPLEDYDAFVVQAVQAKAAIEANDHFAPKGQRAEKDAKVESLVKGLVDLRTSRLVGFDADIAAHRVALLPASTEQPEARRIDFLLSHLRDRTPQEIAVFYNSATDEEKLVLEAAAQSVGRIPTKTADGGLVWAPLLPAETINESIIARASAQNPHGAQKLQELEELRAMHVTVAGIAEATVREVLEG